VLEETGFFGEPRNRPEREAGESLAPVAMGSSDGLLRDRGLIEVLAVDDFLTALPGPQSMPRPWQKTQES